MSKAGAVLEEVKKAVVGKDEVLGQVLLAILAGGHILLEDIPGVGKTTMALAFSRALALEYNRVQFTPDVLPSDITGFSLYNKHTGAMEYQPGAVLCNLFLADELNRATSRTQSALLEAMEEGGVTVDGVTHPVTQPFVVVANKQDKIKKSEWEPNLARIRETLALDAQTPVISFSAEKGLGKEELLGVILDHISADTAQE